MVGFMLLEAGGLICWGGAQKAMHLGWSLYEGWVHQSLAVGFQLELTQIHLTPSPRDAQGCLWQSDGCLYLYKKTGWGKSQ